MSKILLEKWQAIELFCRIAATYEEKLDVDFYNARNLNKFFSTYKDDDAAEQVAIDVFGKKKNSKGQIVSKKPKSFYELGRKIRHSEPTVIDISTLDTYIEYINDCNYDIGILNYLNEWAPSLKQSKLEGTTWWAYFYDTCNNAITNQPEEGVTRAILKLGPFSKAEIHGYKTASGADEIYVGWFSVYGGNGQFLKLNMRLKEFGAKDLHILLYMGTDIVSLALGQFHNAGRSIYAGTVMIEPIPIDAESSSLKPDFFSRNDSENFRKLPEYVSIYFEDRKRNVQRVPSGVTSVGEFYEWHIRKNK